MEKACPDSFSPLSYGSIMIQISMMLSLLGVLKSLAQASVPQGLSVYHLYSATCKSDNITPEHKGFMIYIVCLMWKN